MDKDKIKTKLSEDKENFKMKKHWIKPIFVVTILIILQVFLFVWLYNKFTARINIVNSFWTIFRFILIIYILNLDKPVDYRMAWIIPIAALPFFGIALYLFLEIIPGPRQLSRRLKRIKSVNMQHLEQDLEVHEEIITHTNIDYGLDRYLNNIAGYPIYKNSKLKYFSQGEEYYKALLKDLKEAKDFIFIEFFIIRPGKMLDSILDLLEEKVLEGVDVRFMYDGTNDYHLPSDYKAYLEVRGFEVVVFAPVLPILSTYHNNRDHRKIISIDNKIAYTGGLNLADEYINEIDRFGHWKDNGVRVEGDAVRSFTVMFLNLWELSNGREYNIERYLKDDHGIASKAFVQPYDDAPNDAETVGENVYVDVLNQAKDYCYIMTPYLIPSDRIINAIKFAGKRGVDVRLMMPGKPDKKIPFCMSRSYYQGLIEAGVKIYEYNPGFLHSKSFVSDDKTSVVGTVNLDFRSLHLHYENGVLIYDRDFALTLKKDFIDTQKLCQEITITSFKELSIFYRLSGKMLRIFAPLM